MNKISNGCIIYTIHKTISNQIEEGNRFARILGQDKVNAASSHLPSKLGNEEMCQSKVLWVEDNISGGGMNVSHRAAEL